MDRYVIKFTNGLFAKRKGLIIQATCFSKCTKFNKDEAEWEEFAIKNNLRILEGISKDDKIEILKVLN